MPTDIERPLKTAEVAAMLAVGPETVVNYAEKGKLRGFRLPGKHWRFRRSDVDAFIAARSSEEAAS